MYIVVRREGEGLVTRELPYDLGIYSSTQGGGGPGHKGAALWFRYI